MELPTKYDASQKEAKWYQYWLDNNFFHSEVDEREVYSVVIPPPNVTGKLHMGHMLNNTIQDVLVRRARMQNKNACWVPGTDHASIATEAKVVAKLNAEGIEKSELSREDFLNHAWEWKEKHGGIILEQLKKLGASCDWERTRFTMDKQLSDSVLHVFIDLYEKGLIYRGVRMVNWDPKAQTALSDEEVKHKEVQSKLYYLRYKIQGTDNEYVTIATTRPETILGDTAVCVNPQDERFAHLKGKRVIVPLVNREVPLIEDDYVDMEFGTGALKITPAHDENDYQIGIRHKLQTIDILNDDGTLSEAAQLYVGEDRFEVRKQIVKQLEAEGYLVKIEDYLNKVGFSERTHVPIEPKLSLQWFMKMKKLAEPALENVMNDSVRLLPAKFKNTYRHWMENVRDWCISRQLWWGHRIPVYYINGTQEFVVAKNADSALEKAIEKTGDKTLTISNLKQDEDVLDTWFSSWLWPISVFDGICNPENKEHQYYYPTNDLVTGPDILFFWVARMVMAGYEYNHEKPFSNVYLTGMVRDAQGRKMSKSLGNSPDPLKLIEKYGADGVRVGMLLCSPAGGDLLFDEKLTEQGRNFSNKIWNVLRLVKQWEIDENSAQPASAQIAVKWFEMRLNQIIEQLDNQFDTYRISKALMTVYRLFWDEFASWYIEIAKPAYGQAIDRKTYDATVQFFDKLLKLLHPFIPFITEEIWQLLEQRAAGESIMVSMMPSGESYSESYLADFEALKEVISTVRKIRKEKNIAFKEQLELNIRANENEYDTQFDSVLIKQLNLSAIKLVSDKVSGAANFMIGTREYYLLIGDKINLEEELVKLEKELKYTRGFLKGVDKKLSNERFVQNAPAQVIDNERKKKADAETKIAMLQEQIKLMQS